MVIISSLIDPLLPKEEKVPESETAIKFSRMSKGSFVISKTNSVITRLFPHGGILATAISFTACSLGAGIIGLPGAINYTGLILGPLLLFIITAYTYYSISILIQAVERTGWKTYEDLAQGIINKKFKVLTCALIFLFSWGILSAYIVVIESVIRKINNMEYFPEALKGLGGARILTFLYWFIFILPLSLFREMNTLRYVSIISVISTVYLVVIVVWNSLTNPMAKIVEQIPILPHIINNLITSNITGNVTDNTSHVTRNITTHNNTIYYILRNELLFRHDWYVLVALPVFSFSYCCQTNAFALYSEMKPRNLKTLHKSMFIFLALCCSLYLICGIFGYLQFGNSTKINILRNYNPLQSAQTAVAYVALAFTVTVAFPLCQYPARDTLLQLFEYPPANQVSTLLCIITSIFISVLALVFGMFVPSIQVLFALMGGICGSTLGFIWPGIFYIKTNPRKFKPSTVGWCNFIATYSLIALGFLIGVISSIVSIVQL